MEVYFQIEDSDLIALQKNGIETSIYHRRTLNRLRWFSSLLIFFLTILILKETFTRQSLLILSTAVILYFIVFPVYYRTLAIIKLKTMLRRTNTSNMTGDCKLIITEKGINKEMESTKSFFDWSAFERMGQDNKRLFLYFGDMQALIVPKELPQLNQEKRDEFYSYLRDCSLIK
ncbi:YcxB family protein [Virgibacillus kekensis]|uniref:YcxB family protein n=1 Tax=Virgibacillus kekensis TaxID=202261 RepID=A0ABV9DMJ0_9BACI